MKGQKTRIFKAVLLSFVICHSSVNIALAQPNLDSLYTVWQDENQTDSIRVVAYYKYIWQGFLFSQPDTAFILAEELVTFGQENNYLKAQADAYHILGSSFGLRGHYAKELEYYTLSLKIRKEIGDKEGMAASLNNIALNYSDLGNYAKALDYHVQSLKICTEIEDAIGVARSLINIGVIYNVQGNHSKALDYYTQSLKIQEGIGDKRGTASSLHHIGAIYKNQGDYSKALEYYNRSLKISGKIGGEIGIAETLNEIGVVHKEQGDYPKALDYYTQSLKSREQIGDQKGSAETLNNLALVYREQGTYPKALEYYNRSLKIKEKIGDKNGISSSLNGIGITYKNQGNYSKALEYCKKGLALAEEIAVLNEQKVSCECLFDTYKAMRKGNEALVYLEKTNIINDSLNTKETTKKLQQMEFAKQVFQDSVTTAENERLIDEAHKDEVRRKDNTRNIGFAIGVFFILLAIAVYRRLRFVRKSKAILQVEKDRSENLLLNILPEEIAQELKDKGKADARDFEMVSILFSDFKGFTKASEKLSAQDLVSEINTCFEAFDGIITKNKIEKIKTIGDAYMAAGGLPVPNEGSVKNTVLAALEMQQFISKRKAEMDVARKPAFEMRLGINTGPVVAGIVGVKKFQYDIWGDTVNTASRMENSGEVGKVNIGEATYKLLKNDPDFTFECRGLIYAKGKGMLEMYFVSLKS